MYWFIPTETFEFFPKNTNFSLSSNENINMQFYENMRYPKKTISYNIEECTLQKTDDMKRAFEIIENQTVLNFYPVNENEEISVTCDSGTKIKGGLFIAGEGGPTNITRAGTFNVIREGKILLIKDSKCENPNVAMHELLHVLGFNHSENKNNIMYAVSKCSQTIGDDIINFIDYIYSFQSLPDLTFENISAMREGTRLDINMTLRNNGLKTSEDMNVFIYADDKEIKEIEVKSLDIGNGRMILLHNIFVLRSIDELKLNIAYLNDELDKDNNVALLEIKK